MILRPLILTLAVLGTVVCLHGRAAEEVALRQSLSELPVELGDWRGHDTADLDPETLAVLAADEHVSRNYHTRGGDAAQLFIAYYRSQRQGSAIHSPMNCLPGTGWQAVSARRMTVSAPRLAAMQINRYVVQKGRSKQLVLYWYQSHGRVVASEYWSKAYLVLDGITLKRTDAALIRVMTPIRAGDSAAEASAVGLVRELAPRLGSYLPD
jgi:EpsI family protein